MHVAISRLTFPDDLKKLKSLSLNEFKVVENLRQTHDSLFNYLFGSSESLG